MTTFQTFTLDTHGASGKLWAIYLNTSFSSLFKFALCVCSIKTANLVCLDVLVERTVI